MTDDIALLLSLGDGPTEDHVDLSGDGYTIHWNGFDASPAERGQRTRFITITLDIEGATAAEYYRNKRAIERKLRQARKHAVANPTRPGVTLGVKLGGANLVYFDVVDGSLTVGPDAWATFGLNVLGGAVLVLECLRYGRGEPINDMVSGTITNGLGATHFRAAIPGDVPALLKVAISDISSGSHVINRILMSSLSIEDMVAADVSPILDVTAGGSSSVVSDATAVGGSYVQMNLTASERTIGTVACPDARYTKGTFDLYARVRDSNSNLGQPGAITTLTSTGVPRMLRQYVYDDASTIDEVLLEWDRPTLAGNTLVLLVGIRGNYTIDTPSGWTSVQTLAQTGNGEKLAAFIKTEAASESGTVTVTASGGTPTKMYAWMGEWAGFAYSSPLDRNVTGSTAGTPAASLAITTGAFAQAREGCIGFGMSSNTAVTMTATASGTGFDGNGATELWEASGFGVYSADTDATTSSTFTLDPSGTTNIIGIFLSFKYQNNSGGSLIGDDPVPISIRVSAIDAGGNESQATDLATTSTNADTLAIEHGASVVGTVDHYRYYFSISGSDWEYFDGPSGKPYLIYFLYTNAGTTGNPLTDGQVTASLQASVSLASGTVTFPGYTYRTQLGNSQWELLYIGTFDLPPIPTPEGEDPPDWKITLTALHSNGTGTLDIDAVWLFPTERVVSVSYPGLDLDTKRDWVFETRRDGSRLGRLFETGTTTEAGQVRPIGELTCGPDNTLFVFHVFGEGGISDVSDAKFTLKLSFIPRYESLIDEVE